MDRYLFEGSLQAAAASHQGEQRQLQEGARHGARPLRLALLLSGRFLTF